MQTSSSEVQNDILAQNYGLLLNVGEAAELCHVSKATIRTEIKKGHIPACRVGRAFRIPRHALAKYCKLDETEF